MAFGLGNVFGSMINPLSIAQLAMGPAGWASLAARAIFSAVGQQVIQQLGDKLGLPQGMIDVAQGAFAAGMGDKNGVRQNIREAVDSLGDQFNLSPFDRGQLERAANRDSGDLFEKLLEAAKQGKERAERGDSKSGKGSGSWLREVAALMAQAMDSKIKEMKSLAGQIDKTKTTALQNDLQVATQEFAFLMNSTANMIKTVGEGLGTMARKG